MSCLPILLLALFALPVSAVFVSFDNCLPDSVQHDTPLQLQFVPMFVDAKFDTTDPDNPLQVRVWGNVTGLRATPDQQYVLPPPNDPYWTNDTAELGGKIERQSKTNNPARLDTTLSLKADVLTYEAWGDAVEFCDSLENGTCPLGPSFFANASDPYDLPSFGFTHNFMSSYAFTSFATTLMVKNGDQYATPISCVSTNVTPDLGGVMTGVLTFIPLLVLVFVGVATVFAAMFSPWGTADIFRWSTNYGRDADLLRLVTPGFGDCLQYIQFIALTGSLTLDYPGYYQPVVSKVAWSVLMFPHSFASHGQQTKSLVDGIYVTTGKYGLDRFRQLVGENGVEDIWAGMTIWLLVIIGAVLIIIQVGFVSRYILRHINHTREEDLRAKNMPFSVGNVIRIVFNYFLLPAVALSAFQFVVAGQSPVFTVALAAVMLLLIIGFAAWLLYLISTTKPRSYLFDDLPTVLLYGSLYNTYSDNAAPFALVPVLVTFIRGVAIGAVQPSGVAQLVLLAICEVIVVLALHAFRPFHSPTSMNAYHTFYAVLRFATILLMISFAPSLGISEGPKGWIGYGVLLMHAIVLIFGFLLNAVQTIVEVAARMLGAGGDESGATRGGLVKVFGVRQLSKRMPRRDATSRQSQLSSAGMLDADNDKKAYMESGRLRSQSAGSGGLLSASHGPGSDAIDPYGAIQPHAVGSGGSSTHGGASTFSFLPSAAAAAAGLGHSKGGIVGMSPAETSDPYYRPPRVRRPILGAMSPGARSRESSASGDLANGRWVQMDSTGLDAIDAPEGPSISGRGTPMQSPTEGDVGRSKADYTTREVDFYYGVRGPALNANVPSRRIKTGPTDPTGIPASAAGFFKSLFGGKTKDKGKGFEVVRSARMPPGMVARGGPGSESPPEGIPVAKGGIRNGPIDSDDESDQAGPSARRQSRRSGATRDGVSLVSPLGSDDEDSQNENVRISDVPPLLPGIEVGKGGIELPSRFGSNATSRHARSGENSEMTDIPLGNQSSQPPSRKPTVPRKSSRRKSQNMDLAAPGEGFHEQNLHFGSRDASGLPFGRAPSSGGHSTISTRSSIAPPATVTRPRNTSALGHFSADVDGDRPTSVGYVNQHSIQTVNPSDNPDFLGSSAEVLSGRISNASSTEHQR